MLDPAIADFFEERKSAWMKARVSAKETDEKISQYQQECDERFALENWLPDAASRAKQLSMVTHPGKFTHPSAKTSNVIASAQRLDDGFVRTGNVVSEADVFGNAAAMDVYKFLSLVLEDGKTLLEHLEQGTALARQSLSIKSCDFDQLRAGFLAIKAGQQNHFTSDLVKQVYFPLDDGYHLLSLLTPSGVMFAMKKRIDAIRFSDAAKAAREARRKNTFDPQGFDDIPQLTVIGYGGTKPQNISVLNSQNGGKAYLLSSMPPELTVRNIRFPKRNFFGEAFRLRDCDDILSSLHGIFKLDLNNIHVREKRDRRIDEWFDRVVDRMWQLRIAQADTSQSDNFESLPAYQRIWLDQDCSEQRENSDDWLNKLVVEMADWLINAYRRKMRKQAIVLGDDEWRYIRERINQHRNREALR